MCGEEQLLLLTLDDFIDISKQLLKPPEGGHNENLN